MFAADHLCSALRFEGSLLRTTFPGGQILLRNVRPQNTMKLPATVIFAYGMLIVGIGIAASAGGSMLFGSAKTAVGLALLASGFGVLKEKYWGFLMTPVLVLILIIFSTYRFLRAFELFPSGLLGILGAAVLIVYFTINDAERAKHADRHSSW
jgi:uncharacterized membrane protein (UPF0136 family)